ncbi:MAG: dCMP deaminase family protein [Rhodobacteraceae bacterium]|nr:dCMP deaminase family protein [Paracoccaceae bacterium]
MPNQQLLDTTYMKMARCWAALSKAKRKQVGCLIVKDGAIISDGYNGTPSGFDNTCEWVKRERLATKPEVLHAESNAISKLAKSTQSSDGATLYATCSPCLECSKLIIQCGIIRVVYGEKYRNDDGLKLLKKAGVSIQFINEGT